MGERRRPIGLVQVPPEQAPMRSQLYRWLLGGLGASPKPYPPNMTRPGRWYRATRPDPAEVKARRRARNRVARRSRRINRLRASR